MNYASVESFLRELGAYQLEGFHKPRRGDIQVKEGTAHGLSVVTEYDLESERRTHDFVSRHFPGDSFLGEEHGNVRRDPARYWVLDPIDGTSNFTQGVAYWGPTLAYCDGDGTAAGWIYLPAVEQMFFARRGHGAFLNGQPIHSSAVREYNDLCTVATTSRLHRRFRLTVPAKHRILGSLVANLAYLATGTFAAVYCRGNIWDLAAGVLVASEAGAALDCRPDLRTVDLPNFDVQREASITVFGRGNASLPSLEGYLVPVS